MRETTKWAEGQNNPRRAAVCSCAYSGTVSHSIFEQFVGGNFETAATNGVNSALLGQGGGYRGCR